MTVPTLDLLRQTMKALISASRSFNSLTTLAGTSSSVLLDYSESKPACTIEVCGEE